MAVPKDGWFAQRDRLRQKLDTDTRLSLSARVIGGLLLSMCSPDQPYAYPSIDQIARAVGCSRATVDRAIRQLKAAGYFKVRSGFIDFVNGGGYASHYHPVFSAAKDFSLADVFGPSVTSDVPPTSPVTYPSVTSDVVMSENEGGSPTLPPSLPGRSVATAPPGNLAGAMWDDFLRLYALAVEHNKQGDKPMEKTYADYVEARRYPNVTADSIYAAYQKELAFWQGKRRNKADLLPRFLQNPPKFTGALNGAKPGAANEPKKSRRADSSGPGASTGDAKARIMPYHGYTETGVADALREYEIGWDTDAELDRACLVLSGLRFIVGQVYNTDLPGAVRLLNNPSLADKRAAILEMGWDGLLDYMPSMAAE